MGPRARGSRTVQLPRCTPFRDPGRYLAGIPFLVDPSGFPIFVSLRFEIIEDTNLPAFPEKQIDEMGTNQSISSGDQSAFLMRRHKGDHSESSLVKSLVGVTE
jgi:hypothetical protein